ncbi:hypothetical protein EVC30_098 [Rhizobium phage RHph_Y1_11]|nr:hypothetical protein EVC30_098 [Rhizobium phage RHph_Y1_11]
MFFTRLIYPHIWCRLFHRRWWGRWQHIRDTWDTKTGAPLEAISPMREHSSGFYCSKCETLWEASNR